MQQQENRTTINLHLTAILRLADEATERAWLSAELGTGIRHVKGVKRHGRKIGNWLTGNQAQELLNAVSQNTLQGRRDGAMLGLLLGCGLRRSEVVRLRLDQLQSRENHRVIVPHSRPNRGARHLQAPCTNSAQAPFVSVSPNPPNRIDNLAPHDLRRSCARLCHGCASNRSSFYLAMLRCKLRNGISEASRTSKKRSMTDLTISVAGDAA
jgi:integrase